MNVVLVDGVELEERVVDPEERAEDAVPDDVGGVGDVYKRQTCFRSKRASRSPSCCRFRALTTSTTS